MDSVEKIREAEQNVAQMQEALEALQAGLERAEAVAVAAEEAKCQSDRVLKAALVLVGVTLVLIVASRRRRTT